MSDGLKGHAQGHRQRGARQCVAHKTKGLKAKGEVNGTRQVVKGMNFLE
jgi:hypothetical protein